MPSDIDFSAFRDELEKTASLWSSVRRVGQRALGGVGSGAGIGGAAGAAIGGGAGAVSEYRRAKSEGATGGAAALRGATGAMHGAGRGALIGGIAGGAGLGALNAAKLGPSARTIAKRDGVIGSLGRFGQRQVHSLTGWTPGSNASRGRRLLKLRTSETAKARRVARAAVATSKNPAKAKEQLARAIKADQAARRAEALGLTNLPGAIKSIATRPGQSLRAAIGDQWHGSGAKGKALLLGLPATELAGSMTGPKKDKQGRGRWERAGSSLGTLGLALGPLPLAGSLMASSALGAAGERAGRFAD